MDHELATPKFTSECTTAYIAMIRSFIAEGIVNRLAWIRKAHGMFEALHRNDERDAGADLSFGATSMPSHSFLAVMFSSYLQGPTRQLWTTWSKLQNRNYSASYIIAG